MTPLINSDVRQFWHVLKPLLEEMTEKGFDDPLEEVYHFCRSGQANLLINEDGFVIVTPEENTMLMWVGRSFKPDHDIFKDYEGQLCDIARSAGFKAIRFKTYRKGFERTLSKEWQMKHTVWEKPLE